jgi:hypothetical protein
MPRAIQKKTKLVYGVGVNDADYAIRPRVKGKQVSCPFYLLWVNMLARCYSEVEHVRSPSYIGCTVHSEWLALSSFSKWVKDQDWKGKHLDKDILIQGNKVYGPLSCMFVSAEINTLLNEQSSRRGIYPVGVSIYVRTGRYQAQCKAYGKAKHIGHYDTPKEAYEAYKKFKYKHIAEVAMQQSEPLRTALLNYKIKG